MARRGREGKHQEGIASFRHLRQEPILTPTDPAWQSGRVYNPTAIVVGNRVALLYRAQGIRRTPYEGHWYWPSRIGLAWSTDGTHFTPETTPVLEAKSSSERFGVEDPRIVDLGRRYALTYTAFDGDRARLAMTFTGSRSLRRWQDRMLVFPRANEWTKSGALLGRPIDGRYYLYFLTHKKNPRSGETYIWLAASENLREWTIHSRPALTTRRGHFDSHEVEPGPPPILLPEGILLIYNAARLSKNRLGRTFGVGWALFDKHDPTQLIARCSEPFLTATHYGEATGFVPRVSFRKLLRNRGRIAGTIFAEGLIEFRRRWLLYYGMSDTTIGVAQSRSQRLFVH
jgi:beta-1,2-mannosidase